MQLYRKDVVKKARNNRKEMPPVEALLWSRLKHDQLGFRFRRQMPIGNYIVDFACKSPKLIIEIDGDSHNEKEVYDAKRDQFLLEAEYKVIHFTDQEVFEDVESILEAIFQTLKDLRE